jgi:oligoribonuclease NrnB/cAMP/cGMP phosphodiesterase (DHH superfamily)
MSIYVLYHANCTDGSGAALAAYIALGDAATYIPVQYNKPVPDMPLATVIYMVDFSYPKEILLQLADSAQVVVIDHHKTAKAALEDIDHPNIQVWFDMEQSGATMAWKYFHADRAVPLLLRHIEDRDLWKFKLEGSKEIHRGLGMYPDWID